jgi:mercuric ion binding protein
MKLIMTTLLLSTILSLGLSANGDRPQTAPPKFSEADVNVIAKGVVCSFCAQGIKASFKEDPAIESIEFDSEFTSIYFYLTPGKTLTDEEITAKITDSGYEVESISRLR